MSSALTRAAGLNPEIRLAQAVLAFEADLLPDEKAHFRKIRSESCATPPGPHEVMQLTAEFDRKVMLGKSSGGRCFGPRLTNFLQAVQQFAALGEAVVGASQHIVACGAWSSVKTSILLITTTTFNFDKLSESLMHIGRSAPRGQAISLAYPRSKSLQTCLHQYFIIVVQVCHQFLNFSRKSALGKLTLAFRDIDPFIRQPELDRLATAINDEVNMLMASTVVEKAREISAFRTLMNSDLHQRKMKSNLQVLRFCSTYDYEAHWKRIRKAGNTSLLDANSVYQEWKNAEHTSSTHIYTGRLGSGKSVLLANIVDDLNMHLQQKGHNVSFFFCQSSTPESIRVRTIIGSLARQLLLDAPDLSAAVDLINGVSTTETRIVHDVLQTILSKSFRAYIVLDGLDECEEHDQRTLIDFIRQLQRAFTIHVCISLRIGSEDALGNTHTQLDGVSKSSIPKENPDIAGFIQTELSRRLVDERLILGDPALIITIQNTLLEKCEGMFLWVVLQIDVLCNGNTDAVIVETLQSLSQSLSDSYSRILQRAKSTAPNYQKPILKILVTTMRPLTVHEIREALSKIPGIFIGNHEHLIKNVHRVLASCGSLINIDEEDSTVRFVHQSVRQFLLNDLEERKSDPFSLQRDHAVVNNSEVTSLQTTIVRDLASLEESIQALRATISMTPDSHPDLGKYLDHLGTKLRDRYSVTGDLANLDESIQILQAAIHITPDSHPDRWKYLDHLKAGLSTRHAIDTNTTDLEAIDVAQYQRSASTLQDASFAFKSNPLDFDFGHRSISRPPRPRYYKPVNLQGSRPSTHTVKTRSRTKSSGDYDAQSLSSEDNDNSSIVLIDTGKVRLTSRDLIGAFLAENPQFRILCERVLVRIDKDRFSENLKRLLRTFYNNLSSEAKFEGEKAVAKLLRPMQGMLDISQQLILQIETEHDLAEQEQNHKLRNAVEDKFSLEQGPADVSRTPPHLPEKNFEGYGSGYESSGSEMQDQLSSITGLEHFLKESQAFRSLLRDFKLWFLPTNLRQVLLSIPRDQIWISREQDDSVMNSIKAWIEDNTRVNWNWWPLEARKIRLQDPESRLFWRCTCGERQWIEMSAEHHKLVQELLDLCNSSPISLHWCRKKLRMPLLAYLIGLFRIRPSSLLATSSSTAASRYVPPRTTGSTPSFPPGSRHSAFISHSSIHPKAPQTSPQTQSVTNGTPSEAQSYLLFGIQGGRPTLSPAQVPVYRWSTDACIFKGLRECYQVQRSWVRRWFSIWRLGCCAIVKFNRLNVEYMVREYRDLPDRLEYIYTPRAGDPEARNPPLSPHLFEALYYTCTIPCKRWFPHSCFSPPNGSTTLERLPKRAKCFQKDQTSPIWGMEAVYVVSAVHVLAYHLVLVAGPFAFFGWWIGVHPGDLQNAIVPATIAGGALSLLWMMSGILTDGGID